MASQLVYPFVSGMEEAQLRPHSKSNGIPHSSSLSPRETSLLSHDASSSQSLPHTASTLPGPSHARTSDVYIPNTYATLPNRSTDVPNGDSVPSQYVPTINQRVPSSKKRRKAKTRKGTIPQWQVRAIGIRLLYYAFELCPNKLCYMLCHLFPLSINFFYT